MNIDKLAFAVHAYGGIHPNVYANHIACVLAASKTVDVFLAVINGMKVAAARNSIIDALKKRADCSHVLFVDVDHIVPVDLVATLMANDDCQVVSGLVCKRFPPYPQVGFVKREGAYHPIILPIDGRSYEVEVPAMGCTLIDMKVFEGMEKPYFRDTVEKKVREDGVYNKRSDINFFERVKDAGGSLRIDTRAVIIHLGEPEKVDPRDHYQSLLDAHQETLVDESVNAKQPAYKFVYQIPVYKLAAEAIKACGAQTIADFGCGDGNKLELFIKPITREVTGFDKEINWRPWGTWNKADFNSAIGYPSTFDFIICADVMEHLTEPEALLETIKKCCHSDTIIVFSTPEETTTRKNEDGKPLNPLHVKEWTQLEFVKLLTDNGFVVEEFKPYEEGPESYRYQNNIFICGANV